MHSVCQRVRLGYRISGQEEETRTGAGKRRRQQDGSTQLRAATHTVLFARHSDGGEDGHLKVGGEEAAAAHVDLGDPRDRNQVG